MARASAARHASLKAKVAADLILIEFSMIVNFCFVVQIYKKDLI